MKLPAQDQAARHASLTEALRPDDSIRSLPQQAGIRRSPLLIAAALAMVLAMTGWAEEAPVAFTADEPAGMTEAATKLRSALFSD